jgi:putative ABC transport system permease protein
MNLFQLVFKQMRQRALGTWLTMLSILLSVALATAVLIAYRESGKVFGQTEYGYDVLVGAKGSKLQLVLNTVYHMDVSPGNIPYAVYESLAAPNNRFVKAAVPYGVGDTYHGHRIVGTLPKLFGVDDQGQPLAADRVIEYRPGRRFELAQGRVFHPEKFEAVLGADVAEREKLGIGSKFKATHGMPVEGQAEDVHDDEWEVVGILKPTQTANDGVLFIPLISFFAIAEHGKGLEAQSALRAAMGQGPGARPALPGNRQAPAPAPAPSPTTAPATKPHDDHDHGHDHDNESDAKPQAAAGEKHDDHAHDEKGHAGEGHAEDEHAGHEHPQEFHVHADGTIHLDIPKEAWAVSAVLVKSRGGVSPQSLMYMINNSPLGMAVSPAMVMREFFDTFLKGGAMLLLGVSALVTVVAAVSILVSIYNSVSARQREIAIQRALGATRGRVLAQICLEAALIGLIGGVLGLLLGHLVAGMGAMYFQKTVGERIDWFKPDALELVYLGGVVLIAVLAGLVPGLKAYRTPVATNLVAV